MSLRIPSSSSELSNSSSGSGFKSSIPVSFVADEASDADWDGDTGSCLMGFT